MFFCKGNLSIDTPGTVNDFKQKIKIFKHSELKPSSFMISISSIHPCMAAGKNVYLWFCTGHLPLPKNRWKRWLSQTSWLSTSITAPSTMFLAASGFTTIPLL
jgi:hypothetical protein